MRVYVKLTVGPFGLGHGWRDDFRGRCPTMPCSCVRAGGGAPSSVSRVGPEVESADVTMDCGLTVGCRPVTESGERVMEAEEEEILSDADKISPST